MRLMILFLFISTGAWAQSGNVYEVYEWLTGEMTCGDFFASVEAERTTTGDTRPEMAAVLGLSFMEAAAMGANVDVAAAAEQVALACIADPGRDFGDTVIEIIHEADG